MKEPIEPSEIRAGDLIREEYAEPWHTDGGVPRLATEYTATPELKTLCRRKASGWFLLDRPEPVVVLPTEPTLGWVEYFLAGGVTATRLGVTFNAGASVRLTNYDNRVHPSRVTAFTPATAVPTDALEGLRVAEGAAMDVQPYDAERKNDIRRQAINLFLDAVDAANGATS